VQSGPGWVVSRSGRTGGSGKAITREGKLGKRGKHKGTNTRKEGNRATRGENVGDKDDNGGYAEKGVENVERGGGNLEILATGEETVHVVGLGGGRDGRRGKSANKNPLNQILSTLNRRPTPENILGGKGNSAPLPAKGKGKGNRQCKSKAARPATTKRG